MNSEKFVKLMRTIIAEEVRRVVREELRLSLNELTEAKGYTNNSYEKGTMSSKYKSMLDDDFDMNIAPKPKSVAPINITPDKTVNSLLAETAAQMQSDPNSRSFFEGL